MSVALHLPPLPSAAPLAEGVILRSLAGDLYSIAGFCQSSGTGEDMVLYRSVAETNAPMLVSPMADIQSTVPDEPTLFSIVPTPPEEPFLDYWDTNFPRTSKALDTLRAYYAEPWRKLHTLRYVHRLFSLAKNLAIPLGREEGLALALHRIAVTPGSPEQVQLEQAVLVGKSFVAQLNGPHVSWGHVIRHWDSNHKSAIRDLLLSPLAADALEFCVSEELGWLEQRPMYRSAEGRKEYETQRLKDLITLAANGPLFSTFGDSFEKRARVNIEGLRQAWRKKYS